MRPTTAVVDVLERARDETQPLMRDAVARLNAKHSGRRQLSPRMDGRRRQPDRSKRREGDPGRTRDPLSGGQLG